MTNEFLIQGKDISEQAKEPIIESLVEQFIDNGTFTDEIDENCRVADGQDDTIVDIDLARAYIEDRARQLFDGKRFWITLEI